MTQISENEMPFETALLQLEEVVGALEAGQTPLEESIALLQRGLSLADRCDAVLSNAETTLEQIIVNDDGELVTVSLEDE